MIPNLKIRSASLNDIDFIVESIVEADKSSTNVISTCNIFSLKEDEYRDVLSQILHEDFPNSEYSLSGFLIAETGNEKIGALCSWVEEADGMSNALIKANLLMSFIEKEKLVLRGKKLEIINEMSFDRKPNSIQLEYGYVVESKRREKVFTQLILASIKKHLKLTMGVSCIESILYEGNFNSYDAFIKLQFNIKLKRIVQNKDVYNIFPYNTKVLMNIDLTEKPKYFEKYNHLLL